MDIPGLCSILSKYTINFTICGGLNAWSMGSGTSRRCGLAHMGVALLEEVCHCVGGLSGPMLKFHPG